MTYSCVKDKIGVREESAGMGVMVGGTFNHDGTALYEAMAALFIAQALGMHLGLGQQIVVVFMAIIASVGAAGIPEAGLVTMLAVFTAVAPADRVHPAAAAAGLVPGPLPHGDQRHGRHERDLPARRSDARRSRPGPGPRPDGLRSRRTAGRRRLAQCECAAGFMRFVVDYKW